MFREVRLLFFARGLHLLDDAFEFLYAGREFLGLAVQLIYAVVGLLEIQKSIQAFSHSP